MMSTKTGFLKKSRRPRKLPSIPPSRRNQAFWTTYRYAIDWMQNHQDVVETALNLTEIHPKLIQHKTCNRLWEFITKVAFCRRPPPDMQAKDFRRSNNSSTPEINDPSSKVHIPEISVTSTTERQNIRVMPPQINTVYVCGNLKTDTWHRLFISLSERYAVRSASRKSTVADNGGDADKWAFDVDCVIFFMDIDSLADPHLMEKLQTAKTWNIPVIFIRDPSFTLPKPLPTCIRDAPTMDPVEMSIHDKQTMYRPGTRSTHSSNTITPTSTSSDHLHSYSPASNNETASDTNRCSTRHSHASAHLTVDSTPYKIATRPSSMQSRAQNEQHVQTDSCPSHVFSQSPIFGRSVSSISDEDVLDTLRKNAAFFSRPRVRTSYLTDVVVAGYTGAVLYHSLYHTECVERILYTIGTFHEDTEKDQMSQNGKQNIPYATDSSFSCRVDDAKVGNLQLDMHVPSSMTSPTMNGISDCNLSNSDSLSEVETTYVLYSDDSPSPTIVHWPRKDERGDSNASSCDSFGFQDIDLSQKVNAIDLFSDENSCN